MDDWGGNMLHDFGAFPVSVDVFLDGYDGPERDTYPFRYRVGWLMVAEARLVLPFATHRRPLLACLTDHGETFAPSLAARLFAMPTSLPKPAECDPPDALEDVMDALFWDFLGTADLDNLRLLEEAQEKAAAKIEEFEARCHALDAKIAAHARTLRTERRRSDIGSERRSAIDGALSRLSKQADELPVGMRERIVGFRAETDDLENAVMDGLTDPGELDTLHTVRWEVKSLRGRMRVRLPIFQEEPHSADAWRTRMPSGKSVREYR